MSNYLGLLKGMLTANYSAFATKVTASFCRFIYADRSEGEFLQHL